jgi:4-hydroxy-tetrahydrodipicolinate synthase
MTPSLLTALITPFQQNEKIDFKALEDLIETQIQAQVSGLVILGTTGESELLDTQEKLELINFVCQLSKGRIPITVGCSKGSTKQTLKLAEQFMNFPIEQLMILTPPYLRPSSEGLYHHFKAISNQAIPFIIYHHPLRTGCHPKLHELETLLQLPHCLGLKDASGGFEVISKLSSNYTIYSGDDALCLPHLSLGAAGLISVVSHLIPKAIKQILSLFPQNPYQALELFRTHKPLIDALFEVPNPLGIKAALYLQGKIEHILRSPYQPLSVDQLKALEQKLLFKFPNLIGS